VQNINHSYKVISIPVCFPDCPFKSVV